MCPFLTPSNSGQDKRKVFLVGKLKAKPPEEQIFYQLAYHSLHNLQLGGKRCRKSPAEESLGRLFAEAPKDGTTEHQTYIQWRSAVEVDVLARLTASRRTTIYLQPLGTIPPPILDFSLKINDKHIPLLELLKTFTEIFFLQKQVSVLPTVHIKESGWKITERESKLTGEPQLLVRDFYKYLHKGLPSNGACVMGLSWLDLYPCEKLNFVLGESSFAHKAGVFSFGRFDSPAGRGALEGLGATVNGAVIWQLIKTLTHEVCHLFRLEHCRWFSCTMNESHTVREAMDQPLFLCPVCMRKIQKVCRFNLVERYKKMLDFLSQVHQQLPYVKFADSIEWLENAINFLLECPVVKLNR